MIDVAGPAASAVVLIALVAKEEAAKVLVVSVVSWIGEVWMGSRMAHAPDAQGLVRIIDGVL